MLLRKRSSARSRTRRPAAMDTMIEGLEPRVVLHQVPMATGFIPLTSLEDRDNSVVRILTNAGRIDIELFEELVPAVTANFRNYITSGRYDEQFFNVSAFGLLQMGRYKFNDGTGLATITPDAPIANGFSRSNLQRTVAMVPINTLQADSQFIINLQDNTNLNTQSGGYTVFGKVIQGWDIVLAIGAYQVRNFNQQLVGAPTGPFTSVPVRPGHVAGNPATENALVKIIDIETIKAPGLASYYSNTYVYPEGFRGNNTVERIDIVNEDLTGGNINYFQIIIRYETGERDQVLHTGQLTAGQRFSLKVNDFTAPGLNLVRSNVGYAFDVRSTRKAGVALNRTANSTTLGESFLLTPGIPQPQFTRYNFPRASKSATEQAFLLVEELDGKNVTINVLVYPFSGGQIYVPITIEAFRRGGLNLSALGIPDGDFSMYVTCVTLFVASIT
jgi:peptidyl-prolyl cis-trans isomerase A (cyclophilin A)